jgi:hypothetical protein
MSNNDKKINDLLVVINEKKKTIGVKPRAAWKTNGILKYDNGTHVNINTVTTMAACIDAVAFLLRGQAFYKEAAKLLAVPHSDEMELYLEDFKLRASIIKWDEEKKKLDALERKLKDLRSEDAKTADALSDIMLELK